MTFAPDSISPPRNSNSLRKLAHELFALRELDSSGKVIRWVKFLNRGDKVTVLRGTWMLSAAEIGRICAGAGTGVCVGAEAGAGR